MNAPYDVDPVLGSTSISSYNEWSALFRRYRVLRFGWKITVCNLTTDPLIVTLAPTKTDLGANYPYIQELAELPYGSSRLLSPKGGMDRASFNGSLYLPNFLGFSGYLFDDTVSAPVSTTPLSSSYLNIGVNSSALGVNNVGYRITLWMDTLFYEMASPIS